MMWFDLIVVLIMGSSLLLAAYRGFSQEMTTLGSLAVAGFLSFWLAAPLGNILGISNSILLFGLLIILLFVVLFLLITGGLNIGIGHFIGESRGKIDRILGGIFGFVRGWLIVGLAFMAMNYYADETPSRSLTTGFAETGANILQSLGLKTTAEDKTGTEQSEQYPANDPSEN